MQTLTRRQGTILNRTVDVHIEKAQPVGSKLLREEFELGYSSATIRHEMGILEEMGYLEQPHVSAGRVPTDAGYRFYVDHGVMPRPDAPELTGRILERFSGNSAKTEAESLAEAAAVFLSSLLRETGVVLLVERGARSSRRLFIQGTSYMLEKPEFQDLSKIRPLFKTFEEKKLLIDSLETCGPQAHVNIGHENPLEPLYSCSVVRSAYTAGETFSGTIAVIGPRRMRYARVMSLVEKMTEVMASALREKEPQE